MIRANQKISGDELTKQAGTHESCCGLGIWLTASVEGKQRHD